MILPIGLAESLGAPLAFKFKPEDGPIYVNLNFKAGDKVIYAGSVYEVAHIKMFGNGPMVGIYDEPPSKHIDYLKPGSLKLA